MKMRSTISELATALSVTFLLLVRVADQVVLSRDRCPAKTQYTAVFAMRNGKLSRLGGDSPLHTPP